MAITKINENELNKIKESSAENKVLVFSAPAWCSPCKILHGTLEQLEKNGELQGVHVFEIDIDESTQFATTHNIRSVPTSIKVDNDIKPIGNPLMGAGSGKDFVAWATKKVL